METDCAQMQERLSNLRRTIHKCPELGFQEIETGKLIAKTLSDLGLEVQTNVNKTGVVGVLKGAKPGRTIAFRADMDALPIQELNETPYKSQKPNVMHACGHDGNTTILLGTAMLLCQQKDSLCGNVKFIFQPSEEAPPGGAKGMIEEGVLENPKVDAVVGVHVDTDHPIGKASVRFGAHTANADRIHIVIKGRGGHAAQPHKCVDPIYISAMVIQAIHGLPSRFVDPVEPFVVTLGKISGGDTFNVIPNDVEILGTVRTVTTETQDRVLEQIRLIVETIPKTYNGEGTIEVRRGYPVCINDAGISSLIQECCEAELGEDTVSVGTTPSMGGEDFAYFAQKVPSSVLMVGVRNEELGMVYPWHHARFDMDERGLVIGAKCLARIATTFLCRD
ncbi:MAG TPA: amidohydrolase [bacterium]|nr:amidohydrolase [bacterium]